MIDRTPNPKAKPLRSLVIPFLLLTLGTGCSMLVGNFSSSSDADASPSRDGGDSTLAGEHGDPALTGDHGDPTPPGDLWICSEGSFHCIADGRATFCSGGIPLNLGPCPLGCDETARACQVPSNELASLVEWAGNLDVECAGQITINSDSGEIQCNGAVIREAGAGLDAPTGIRFETVPQPDAPNIGVLSVGNLVVHADTVVRVQGTLPLAILAAGTVEVHGTVDVGAGGEAPQEGVDGDLPGPGGFPGAASASPPTDPDACAGLGASDGLVYGGLCSTGCASGGGGAGHGGAGGDGGSVARLDAPANLGGAGGESCGEQTLVPLVGGRGGAAGTLVLDGEGDPVWNTSPGSGGGGGGALQITAVESIHLFDGATIIAPGGGGGLSISAGGAGGGAGGAILLEANTVQIDSNAVVAANGGGGGGGDCM